MENSSSYSTELNRQLLATGLKPVDDRVAGKFDQYLSLLLRWNARINLTAIREPQDILSRHFVESIACAQHLPVGIGSLLDFGSGAGLPGIPIALCRPEIAVTLAESQTRKAAFLREVVRTLQLTSTVWARRAEEIAEEFDCVTIRAVDRMDEAVPLASALVRSGGWLAALTTSNRATEIKTLAGQGLRWLSPAHMTGSEQRILLLAQSESLDQKSS